MAEYIWNLLVEIYYRIAPPADYSTTTLEAPSMRKILDEMEQHYHGPEAKYDDATFNELLECMNDGDDILVQAQDNAWKKGFIDYYASDGTEKDYRGQSDRWGASGTPFIEGYDNVNKAKFGDIDIY